jgi:Tol biopolymer transport system component
MFVRETTTWRIGALSAMVIVGWLCSLTPATAAKPGGGGGTTAPPVIAFLRDRAVKGFGTTTTDLRVMDANGGNAQSLTTGDIGGAAAFPRWSPDGQRVLFTRHNTDTDGNLIMTAAANGTNQQIVVTSEQVVAFVMANNSRHTGATNYVIDLGGWSPDGQWAAFTFKVAYDTGEYPYRLFAVRIADGSLVQITDEPDGNYEFGPDWSPSLNLIAYVHVDISNSDEPARELWVVDPVTLSRRQLIAPYSNTMVSGLAVRWSHGGNPATGESSLVFQSRPDALIVDVDVDAADPIVGSERIAVSGYELQYPAWSPDDTKLVLTWGGAIGTIDLLTGARKTLYQAKSNETVRGPDWRIAP